MKKLLYFISVASFTTITAQVNLTANLKVCMPFNGNAADLSGMGNNGTVSNATLTTDRFGNANSAYHFNPAVNSNIAISSLSSLAPTNELSISMWAKSDFATSNCLFALSPDNQNDRCVGCAQYVNGGSTLMIWDYGDLLSGGRTSVSSIPTDINNWHHYTYVVSQSGNIKNMYLDGSAVSTAAYNLTCVNKNFPFLIGGGFSNGTNTKIMWQGKIDDVCIYNRALNSAEVAALYSGTNACFSVGLKELTDIQNMQIFPSISENGLFTLSSSELNDNSLVEIYSMDGKRVKTYSEMQEHALQIDIKEMNSGIYYLKLINANGVYTKKIIKL